MFIQLLVNGICSASLLAIAAIGFALVYNTTNYFHFAYGAIYTSAAYLIYWFYLILKLPLIISLLLTFLIVSLLSLSIEQIVYKPLEARYNSSVAILISSFGVYLFIINFIAMIAGNEVKILSPGIEKTFQFGSVIVTRIQLIGVFAFIIVLISYVLFLRTKSGLLLRGYSINPNLTIALGYNPHKIRYFIFIVSSILAAIASIISAFDVGFDPNIGSNVVLLSAVALIIGGVKIYESPILGAFIIGILQSIIIWQISARWVDTFVFLLLILFLLFKPTGILGKKLRVEEVR